MVGASQGAFDAHLYVNCCCFIAESYLFHKWWAQLNQHNLSWIITLFPPLKLLIAELSLFNFATTIELNWINTELMWAE